MRLCGKAAIIFKHFHLGRYDEDEMTFLPAWLVWQIGTTMPTVGV